MPREWDGQNQGRAASDGALLSHKGFLLWGFPTAASSRCSHPRDPNRDHLRTQRTRHPSSHHHCTHSPKAAHWLCFTQKKSPTDRWLVKQSGPNLSTSTRALWWMQQMPKIGRETGGSPAQLLHGTPRQAGNEHRERQIPQSPCRCRLPQERFWDRGGRWCWGHHSSPPRLWDLSLLGSSRSPSTAGPRSLAEGTDFICGCLRRGRGIPSQPTWLGLRPNPAWSFTWLSTTPGTVFPIPFDCGSPIPPGIAKGRQHSPEEGGKWILRPLPSAPLGCPAPSPLPRVGGMLPWHIWGVAPNHVPPTKAPQDAQHGMLPKAVLLAGVRPLRPSPRKAGGGHDSSAPGRSLSKRRGPRRAWLSASTEEAGARPQIRSRIFPFNDLLYGLVFCFVVCFFFSSLLFGNGEGKASLLFLAGPGSSWCPSDASWDRGCARDREGGTRPRLLCVCQRG